MRFNSVIKQFYLKSTQRTVFISDILWYDCMNCKRDGTERQWPMNAIRTDRHEGWNIYVDDLKQFHHNLENLEFKSLRIHKLFILNIVHNFWFLHDS